MPGADEDWRLAPLAMGWEGLSEAALCRQLKNPDHNGGRTGAGIIDHLRSDLVKWAWSPGSDTRGRARSVPPLPYADFLKAATDWVASGAECP